MNISLINIWFHHSRNNSFAEVFRKLIIIIICYMIDREDSIGSFNLVIICFACCKGPSTSGLACARKSTPKYPHPQPWN